MNYTKLYNSIIDNRKKVTFDGYTERHHIVPKCLGGSDSRSNIVRLSAREHFICHYLLTKIYCKNKEEHIKVVNAFIFMKAGGHERYVNSRLYSYNKVIFSRLQSERQQGSLNPAYGSEWICNKTTGKSRTVKKGSIIPEGWERGRINVHGVGDKRRRVKLPLAKKCKRCGDYLCARPDICRKYVIIHTLIAFFGFDSTKIGTSEFYTEFDRIANLLYTDYHVNKLSSSKLTEKYKITSRQRLDSVLKSLGIEKRSLSQALINFYEQVDR